MRQFVVLGFTLVSGAASGADLRPVASAPAEPAPALVESVPVPADPLFCFFGCAAPAVAWVKPVPPGASPPRDEQPVAELPSEASEGAKQEAQPRSAQRVAARQERPAKEGRSIAMARGVRPSPPVLSRIAVPPVVQPAVAADTATIEVLPPGWRERVSPVPTPAPESVGPFGTLPRM